MPPTYNLSHFRILLVEDNAFIRRVLEDLLGQLSVGAVDTAANGLQALDILKSSKIEGRREGSSIDLVLSDKVMSPIDGLLLLEWVRNSKESPNRFMPFIMISGASDKEDVKKARDLGVNEFLAKPFSAASVSRKLLQVIDRPRPFITSHDYFGPDRHRHRDTPPGRERRKVTEEDTTVVYAPDNVIRPEKPSEIYSFHSPNMLKEKAGGHGEDGPGELPSELLEEADKALNRKALEFHDWALTYLAELSAHCRECVRLPPNYRRLHFEKINLLAHELRGQGGTFGYPIVTFVGKMLYGITKMGCDMNDTSINIIKAHIDTLHAVFRDKVTGDGGEVGRNLIASLNSAIKRYMNEAG